MQRRWFIRILFMLPILLCLAGWLWSGTHGTFLRYQRSGRKISVGIVNGSAHVTWQFIAPVSSDFPDGWRFVNGRHPAPSFWPRQASTDIVGLLGLGYGGVANSTDSFFWRSLRIPFWFLIVALGGLFAWVWRKTRPKVNPKTAFPVEVKSQGA